MYSDVTWEMVALVLDLIKPSGPIPANNMEPNIITDCGSVSLELN